jgi:hypothetical protein
MMMMFLRGGVREGLIVRALVVGLVGVATLILAGSASALTVSESFNNVLLPDDDSGLAPDVTASFTFDPLCDGDLDVCTVDIQLTYNALRDTNNGGVDTASSSYAHVLSGVIWGVVGSNFSVVTASSTVTAEQLVGGGVDGGAGFPTSGTTDISGHYGFRDDLAITDLGSYILSSVGDVTAGGTTNIDVVGVDNLLPGAFYSGAESNPPNGNPFATLNDATSAFLNQYGDDSDGVWNQNTLSASLRYTGTLSEVTDISPLFGTDGVVPEPSTALLLGAGLTCLGIRARRRNKR